MITYDYSLYVVERGNHRVQKFSRGSTVATTVAGSASGIPGPNSADLNDPSVILLDSAENFYIADAGNSRIQYWQRGASSGVTAAGSGMPLNEFSCNQSLSHDLIAF